MAAIVCTVLAATGTAAALLRSPGSDAADDRAAATRESGGAPTARDLASPVLLASDTQYVQTKILESGDLVVTHWIHTSQPMNQLSVDVPTTEGLDEQAVDVKRLVVAADGVRVDSPTTFPAGGWVDVLPAASDLYVRYQLSGVMQLSDSVDGRALATMTSLDVGVGRELVAKTQTFPGAQVLTLACLPPGARAIPRPCGSLDDDTWTVATESEAVRDTVIGQFDLAAQ